MKEIRSDIDFNVDGVEHGHREELVEGERKILSYSNWVRYPFERAEVDRKVIQWFVG
jgi:hypothetical protein